MRLIDYFNIIALVIFAGITALALLKIMAGSKGRNHAIELNADSRLSVNYPFYLCTVILLFAAGFILRFYYLSSVPDGFNQDEASLGYDAWCLLKYGVDRNGYRYPIYPITWGSGGGSSLIIYLIALSEAVFGRTVFAVRFVPAFFGCLTLLVFYLLLKRISGRRLAWIGLFVLAICPWHIMLSRYTLDSNTTPFFVLLALLLLSKGVDTGKTGWYLGASAVFALCLYTYGSTTIVVPAFLVLICLILMRTGKLTVKQLVLCIVIFLLVAFPIGVFYLINFLDLPEILTPWFSINRLTASRSSTFVTPGPGMGRELWDNLVYLVKLMTYGAPDEEFLFSTEWYGELYRFTFPVTILGMAVSFRSFRKLRKREYDHEMAAVLFFLCSFAFSLFVKPRLAREVLLFPMLIYFEAKGLQVIAQQSRKAGGLLLALMLAGALLFTRDYFGAAYRGETRFAYMPGYLDAVEYAEKVRKEGGEILSTKYNMKMPFILALFATGTNPHNFQDTVVYQDDKAEYREAIAFTHYRFQTLEELQPFIREDSVMIINHEELDHMDFSKWEMEPFGEFCVMYRDSSFMQND